MAHDLFFYNIYGGFISFFQLNCVNPESAFLQRYEIDTHVLAISLPQRMPADINADVHLERVMAIDFLLLLLAVCLIMENERAASDIAIYAYIIIRWSLNFPHARRQRENWQRRPDVV